MQNTLDKYGYRVVMNNALGVPLRRVYYGKLHDPGAGTFSVMKWEENIPIAEREYTLKVPFVEPWTKDLSIEVTDICRKYDLLIEQCKQDQTGDIYELEEQKEREIGRKVVDEIGRYSLGLWQYAFKYVNEFDLLDIVKKNLEILQGVEKDNAIERARLFLKFQIKEDCRKGDAEELLNCISKQEKGQEIKTLKTYLEAAKEPKRKEIELTFPNLFHDPKDWQVTLQALRELSLVSDRGEWIGGNRKKGAIVGVIAFWKDHPKRFQYNFTEYELAAGLAKKLGIDIGKSTVSDNSNSLSQAGKDVREMLVQMLK